MKKLSLFLAMGLVIAAGAFAQVSVGGTIGVRGDIINNQGDGDGAYGLGRDWEMQGRLQLNVGNGAGTAGGTLRMWANHGAGANAAEPDFSPSLEEFHGFVWWQPISQLRLTIGRDPWGMHGAGQVVGWAFNANNSESWFLGWGDAGGSHYGTTNLGRNSGGQRGAGSFSRNTGFYPGFGDTGITAVVRPVPDMPELSFVVAVPWMYWDDAQFDISHSGHWAEGLIRSHLGVRYTIAGVGTASFTWIGGPGDGGWLPGGYQLERGDFNTTGSVRPHSSKFFLSFHATALQAMGLQFNVGLAYMVPYTRLGTTSDLDVTTHFPIEAGLGVLFNRGPIRIPLRMAATFAGSEDGNAAPMRFAVNINPRYDLGFMNVHLAAGIQFLAESRGPTVGGITPGHAALGWSLTPHVSREFAGPTRVFAGVHLEASGTRRPEDDLVWRIPFGIHLEW